MMTRAPVRTAFGAAVALVASLAACDGDSDTPPRDHGPTEAAIVQEAIGAGFDADAVIATVDGDEIRIADLAVAMEFFPGADPGALLDDLIDARLAAAAVPDDAPPSLVIDRRDARTRGRAVAWVREHVWTPPELQIPDEARVQMYLTDPSYDALFGVPALRRVTQVLVERVDEGQGVPDAHLRTLADQVYLTLDALGRPVRADDMASIVETINATQTSLDLGVRLTVDRHFWFPRVYSGTARWSGLEAVVESFAEVAFTTEVGQMARPVETEFGWHVILVEEAREADYVADEERREIAERLALSHRRGAAFSDRLSALMARAQVIAVEENVGILQQSAEERLRTEGAAHGDRFLDD